MSDHLRAVRVWHDETDALIRSQRPMTPEEQAREQAAVTAYYDGTASVEDFLVRAETELRYACHVSTCNCSATAIKANRALGYIRQALASLRHDARDAVDGATP
jgi:hypothetical protein